jgi:hypothetical protein
MDINRIKNLLNGQKKTLNNMKNPKKISINPQNITEIKLKYDDIIDDENCLTTKINFIEKIARENTIPEYKFVTFSEKDKNKNTEQLSKSILYLEKIVEDDIQKKQKVMINENTLPSL